MAPLYISDLINVRRHARYSLRSGASTISSFPKGKMLRTFGDWSFSMAAPKLWNELPVDLHNVSSLETSKSCLKTYLFKLAFSHLF